MIKRLCQGSSDLTKSDIADKGRSWAGKKERFVTDYVTVTHKSQSQ